MSMQDKEFDDLFRSKLEDLEMEPPAQVWQNIDDELRGKRKKTIMPLLNVAASVIVLIIAAVLFIPKKEISKPRDHGKNDKAQTAVTPAVVKPHINAPAITPVLKLIQPENTVAANRGAIAHHQGKKEVSAMETATQPGQIILQQEPLKVEEQPLIAVVPMPKPVEAIAPVVPDKTIPLITKLPADNDMPALNPAPVLASIDEAKPAKAVKRHGFHTFGDLVNLVVAKVDKRKDKLIEFTNTDDDESTITAVNMGPIKIKKDK